MKSPVPAYSEQTAGNLQYEATQTDARGSQMTLFETDGFLSEQVSEADTEIAVRYQAAFGIATQANQLTHKVLFAAAERVKHFETPVE